MQSLSWYVRRLQAMSVQEIVWRAQSAARGITDRGRLALKLYPKTGGRSRRSPASASAPRWCPVPLGDWAKLDPGDPASLWRTRLIDRADRALYSAKHLGRNRIELWEGAIIGHADEGVSH